MRKTVSLVFVVVAFLLLTASVIYRFIFVPIQTRHECSYTEVVKYWTISDLQSKGMIKVCPTPMVSLPPAWYGQLPAGSIYIHPTSSPPVSAIIEAETKYNNQLIFSCESKNMAIRSKYISSGGALIEKTYYVQATQEEYNACLILHDNSD